MSFTICLQCNRESTNSANRIILDSCGHYKCRICLLNDDNHCLACERESKSRTQISNENITVEETQDSAKRKRVQRTETAKQNCQIKYTTEQKTETRETVKQTSETRETAKQTSETRETATQTRETAKQESETKESAKQKSETKDTIHQTNETIDSAKQKNETKAAIQQKDETREQNIEISVHTAKQKYGENFQTAEKTLNVEKSVEINYTSEDITKNCEKKCAEISFQPGESKIKKSEKTNLGRERRIITRVRTKELPEHIIELNNDGGKSYECKVCASKFKARSQIDYHSFCNTSKPYPCHLCPQAFVKNSHLTNHLNVHAGKKDFVCEICNAAFYQKSKLRVHSKLHTGVKKHECTKCNAKFYNASALNNHNLIHLEDRPYACKKCPSTFKDSSNLRKHETYHLGPKYNCSVCNAKYKTKYSLKVHHRTHSKDHPFKCEICPKTFITNRDAHRHQVIHTNDKKFSCTTCHNSFKRQDNLIRHIQNTHSETSTKSLLIRTATKKKNDINSLKKLVQMESQNILIENENNSVLNKNDENLADMTNFEKTDISNNEPVSILLNGSNLPKNIHMKCSKSPKPLISETPKTYVDNSCKSLFDTSPKCFSDRSSNSIKSSPKRPIEKITEVTSQNKMKYSNNYMDQNEMENFYARVSKFKNYENFIPGTAKENLLEAMHSSDNVPLTNPQEIWTNYVSNELPQSEKNYTNNSVEQEIDDNSFSKNEIIEANNQRMSVIFSCAPPKKPTVDNEHLKEKNLSDENTPHCDRLSELYQTQIDDVDTAQNNSSEINQHNYSEKSLRKIQTNVCANSGKTVGEIYKDLFLNNSTINSGFNSNNFITNNESFSEVKSKSNSSMLDSNNGLIHETQDKNQPKLPYYHKKVNYGHSIKSLLSLPGNREIVKQTNMSSDQNQPVTPKVINNNNNSEKQDLKRYYPPESLELYRKILIPSYKGSTHLKHNNNATTNKLEPGQKEITFQYFTSEIPPLVPLSGKSQNIMESPANRMTSLSCGQDLSIISSLTSNTSDNRIDIELNKQDYLYDSTDSHKFSIQVEPIRKKSLEFQPNQTNDLTSRSYSSDVHWRRRLAQNSNQKI